MSDGLESSRGNGVCILFQQMDTIYDIDRRVDKKEFECMNNC